MTSLVAAAEDASAINKHMAAADRGISGKAGAALTGRLVVSFRPDRLPLLETEQVAFPTVAFVDTSS
jgi:hypothetical protein